jgi:hypothetical protein
MRPEVQVLPGPLVRPASTLDSGSAVKKLLAVVAAVGALIAVKRRKGHESTDVWRQATK